MAEVRLLAGLRRQLGAKRLESSAPCVRALLEELAARGGEDVRELLFGEDLRVLVNGRSVRFLDGLETELREDDDVTLHLAGARGYPGG